VAGLVAQSGSLEAQELAGDASAGALIYEQRCARCHGVGGWGDGHQARDLIVPPTNFHSLMSQIKSDEQLLASIEFGVVMSPMHGWRDRLTPQQLRDVLAYVRMLSQRGR
jgi:mono/diheme cytochrome c family protein